MNSRARYQREVKEYKLRALSPTPFDGDSASLINFPSFLAHLAYCLPPK